MQINRLIVILEDWARWMKSDNHKLGYPNKSSYFSSGGESTADVFEHMVDETDNTNVKILNACIESLNAPQKKAIYYRWLGGKKPMDNLLSIVGRRIYA